MVRDKDLNALSSAAFHQHGSLPRGWAVHSSCKERTAPAVYTADRLPHLSSGFGRFAFRNTDMECFLS